MSNRWGRLDGRVYNWRGKGSYSLGESTSSDELTTVEEALLGYPDAVGKFDPVFLREERARETQRYEDLVKAQDKAEELCSRTRYLLNMAENQKTIAHENVRDISIRYGFEARDLRDPAEFQRKLEMHNLRNKFGWEARLAREAWEEAAKKEARRVRRKELRERRLAFK